MNYIHLLTIVLVALKIIGYGEYSWLMAFIPSIILFGLSVFLFLVALAMSLYYEVKYKK